MDISFSELGFKDVTLGAQVFKVLDVDEKTMRVPQEMAKVKDIAEYFSQIPDASFWITKVAKRRNPATKPLDHVWTYVDLQRQKQGVEKKLESLSKEIKYYE